MMERTANPLRFGLKIQQRVVIVRESATRI